MSTVFAAGTQIDDENDGSAKLNVQEIQLYLLQAPRLMMRTMVPPSYSRIQNLRTNNHPQNHRKARVSDSPLAVQQR